MKKQAWIGIAIAGGCLYLASRVFSIQELWITLQRASPLPIAIGLLLYVVEFYFRSFRWALLLRPIRPTPGGRLYWVVFIGYFANNILPFRLGEIVRAKLAASKLEVPMTATLGTVVLERLCDAFSFLTTFLVVSALMPFPAYMKKGALLMGVTSGGAMIGLFLIHRYQTTFDRLLSQTPFSESWKQKLQYYISHFMHSLTGFRSLRLVSGALAFSLTIWLCEGTFLFLMARAFEIPLSYPGAFFLLFAFGLSVALPQAPGYVGTFELFGMTALYLLGIPKSQGLPFVLATHGIQFIFIAVMGGFGLWKEGLSFKSLASTSQTATPLPLPAK